MRFILRNDVVVGAGAGARRINKNNICLRHSCCRFHQHLDSKVVEAHVSFQYLRILHRASYPPQHINSNELEAKS